MNIIDCEFNITYNDTAEFKSYYDYTIKSYSEKLSKDVIIKAKSIVGKSKDIAAAKKLAKWIGKHISYEAKEGFYQNSSTTLKRKKGNCCSQTDLFIQMCDAIGLSKKYKIYYVHVGYINYPYRHFFAIFDNICVDVSLRSTSPWGHAKIGKRSVYSISKYPQLPIKRFY